MSGIKLPTESWLEGINETLAKEGLIPERRPIEVFRRWCIESQQSLAFGADSTGKLRPTRAPGQVDAIAQSSLLLKL